MVSVVVEEMLSAGITMQMETDTGVPAGVRRWLGWPQLSTDEIGNEEEWARDMKQLPCQRPRAGVKVVIGKAGG